MRRLSVITAALGLIGLILTEVALRVVGFGDPPLARLDDKVEYVLIPDRSYRRFGNRIEINGQGLRAPDLTKVPSPDQPRVLVIGDSVIYGNHFLDQSETVAAQMSKDLITSTCQPLAVPVAVSSWGPVNQAAYLKRHGDFGAKVALIVLSGHDLLDTPTWSSNVVPYRLTPSYTAITDAAQAVLQRRAVAHPKPDPTVSNETRAAQSLAALDAMAVQLRTAKISLSLVYHPTLPERQGQPHMARAIFADWAQRQAIPFLDLGVILADPGTYRDHIHPAANGAETLALTLAQSARTALDGC